MAKGMTEIEELVRLIMNNMYTSVPAKVVSVNKRYVKMQIMVGTKAVTQVPLINVPVLRMLGGSVPVKEGMIFPVWFTKNALGEFLMSSFSAQQSKGPIEELQFDRNNAFALPFLFDEKLDIMFPETVEFDIKVVFKEPIECEKEALFKKEVTHESNVITKGDTTINGNATISGKMSSSNYDSHTHTDSRGGKTGGPE